MKKILLYLLLFPLIFSCKKDEITDEQRPDYRLTEALAKYNDLLSGSANGWKGHLFPAAGGGYGFLFNFNGKNRVEMLADIDDLSGVNFFESSYRLKAAALPSLYFDTYSYLHLLADPDPGVNGGQPGWGLYSDFEFSILESTADTIKLKGNLNGSTLVLVKASATEAAAYKAGNLNVLKKGVDDYLNANSFNYLETARHNTIAFNLDLNRKQLILSYDSLGTLKTRKVGFAFSGMNDLVLSENVIIENLVFSKIQLSEDKGALSVVTKNQTTPVLISNEPLFSFDQMLGVQFSSVALPFEEEVPGTGSDYNAVRNSVLLNARDALSAGSTFPELTMSFNTIDKTMVLDLIIVQSGQVFHARYAFYYTKKGESYAFEYVGALDGNATYLQTVFKPFVDRITSGTFKFDYEHGQADLMGSGTNSLKPDFKFIGYLR